MYMNGDAKMTHESTVLLLKCKLHSLETALEKAISKGSTKDIINKWKINCEETQDKISEMEDI